MTAMLNKLIKELEKEIKSLKDSRWIGSGNEYTISRPEHGFKWFLEGKIEGLEQTVEKLKKFSLKVLMQ